MSWGGVVDPLPSSGLWTITTFIPAQISRSRAETRLDHLNKIAPKVWGNWRKCLVYSERATEKKEESNPDTTCDCGPVSLMWQDGPLWNRQCNIWGQRKGDGNMRVLLLPHFSLPHHSPTLPIFTSNTALRERQEWKPSLHNRKTGAFETPWPPSTSTRRTKVPFSSWA